MPITLSGSLSLTGSVVASGNLTTIGTITAQTLVVQTITSSINYITGSSDFGSLQSNRHTFTGSMYVTGSNIFANIGTLCVSNCICANTISALTISAGSPTNSRIVANADQMYGYYASEANYRWSLGRDVWAGGSSGLAFGVGGTTTCYAMIGDPSGFGCTIGFSILVPNGCSGTTYEKMRINSTGLGIGTSSIPIDHILQVHSPCAYARMALTNPTTGVASGDGLIFQMEGTTAIIKNQEADALKLGANGSETQLVLTSGGLIGVNTASPFNFGSNSGMIDVRSQNTSAVAGVFISNSDATARLTAYINNAATATVGTSTSHALQLVTVDTERARIQTNGFFGIAAVTPRAVFDVACGNAHSIISSWQKTANNNTMYNGFDIYMDESSFAGQLYVQANGGGIGVQAVYDVLASYDRLCVIQRSSMNRGNGECLTIPSYFYQAGAKRICIQQNNGASAAMNISAMLIGTSYGGSYICAQG